MSNPLSARVGYRGGRREERGGHTVSFVSGGLEKEKEGGMEDINVVIIRPFFYRDARYIVRLQDGSEGKRGCGISCMWGSSKGESTPLPREWLGGGVKI